MASEENLLVIINIYLNSFVNHYRVEEFKTIAKDPGRYHLTIVRLAYECGFNSKTVFNTYFKKQTGLTPSEILKD